MKKKHRPERIPMRIIKGGMQPADSYARDKLRAKGYHLDDVVFATFSKPRNPGFHRLAHAFGRLVTENIDAFTGMDCHKALKRLQMEANIGCDEIAYQVDGHGMISQRIPQSMSFESMEQGEFEEVFRGLCRHVADRYWPELDEHQVAEMAETMVHEN